MMKQMGGMGGMGGMGDMGGMGGDEMSMAADAVRVFCFLDSHYEVSSK